MCMCGSIRMVSLCHCGKNFKTRVHCLCAFLVLWFADIAHFQSDLSQHPPPSLQRTCFPHLNIVEVSCHSLSSILAFSQPLNDFSREWSKLHSVLCGSLGVGACAVLRIHTCGVVRNSFTTLERSPGLHLFGLPTSCAFGWHPLIRPLSLECCLF